MKFEPRHKQFTIVGFTSLLDGLDKKPSSPERQILMAKNKEQRNKIGCSFGSGKSVYQANDIRTKSPEIIECGTWICYFAKGVTKFSREFCPTLYELLRSLILAVSWRFGLGPACQTQSIKL